MDTGPIQPQYFSANIQHLDEQYLLFDSFTYHSFYVKKYIIVNSEITQANELINKVISNKIGLLVTKQSY
ncbi:hypothetical protein NBRC116591_10650 [Sessilibacter corallicola]|uniref:Uncharacterized protein n=1 Tax=Sessilibacter corallicola TaxID=2904075 RepID=A0ABQ0A6H6_9GAMM